MIIPVVLSGGSGTRLWPLSRELYPKQFLDLCSDKTMIQETLFRLDSLSSVDSISKPLVICNESHRFLVAEQLRKIERPGERIILEPVPRNTAPAISVAAFFAAKNWDDPILLILPADHVIRNLNVFCASMKLAYDFAMIGKLVTFGIVPDRPETGYGYIKTSAVRTDNPGGLQIEAFVEKPDRKTAAEYVNSGRHFWNSGMFVFKASTFLAEIQKINPEIYECCNDALKSASSDSDFLRLDRIAFEKCPSISVDYAVMEKTANGIVIPLNAGWNDIGSWKAIAEVCEKDEKGNSFVGDVIAHNAERCYVKSSARLVSLVGASDLIVVETADAVLVAKKDSAQSVKHVVDILKSSGRSEVVNHRITARPWGSFETVDLSARFQVKRITVNPGAALSLQMHYHRAEHWVIVSGTAKITKGEETFILSENQSIYIPLGVLHRLENPGKIILELIEIQSGSYLGEDDIVRFDDCYGRS